MSLTLILTSKNSIFVVSYFPAIDLSECHVAPCKMPCGSGDYELDLTDFETYNTIPNVNSSNNKFYFDKDDKEIVIPKGLYELHDIDRYLKRYLRLRRHRNIIK